MKHLLLIATLLLPLGAYAAETPSDKAMDQIKKDAGSADAKKKAEEWDATKYNNAMLNEQVDGVQIDQSSAGIVGSNLMFDCVETNLMGRSDKLCKDSPNHPECVGLNKAIDNATACLDPIDPPDGVPCKKYGTKDYSMDEWIAFGTQYYTGMTECYSTKTRIEAARIGTVDGKDTLRMESLTSIMSSTPTGPGLDGTVTGKRVDTSSSVTGNPKDQELAVNPSGFKSISDLDDGSVFLGYEKGELLKGAAEGKAFYQVVTKSPFAENLKPKNLKILENGLMEANLVIDKARVAGRLPALGENEEQYANATKDDGPGSNVSKREETTGASSWRAAKEEAAPAAGPAAAPAVPTASAPAAPAPERKLMLHERIALLEAQAKARLSGKGDGRGLNSLGDDHLDHSKARNGAATGAGGAAADANAAAGIGSSETSLFERITLAYRKRSDGFKSLESAEGRELRTMEAPKIFREL